MAFALASILPLPDMLAPGWFFLCRVGYTWYADHRRRGTRELASVLHEYRLRWMRLVIGAHCLQVGKLLFFADESQ